MEKEERRRGEREIDRLHVYDIYICICICTDRKKKEGELEIQEKRNRIYLYATIPWSRLYIDI